MVSRFSFCAANSNFKTSSAKSKVAFLTVSKSLFQSGEAST